MTNYRLFPNGEADLERIWMYGLERWRWGVEAMEPAADGISGSSLFRNLYLWWNGTEAIPGLASF